MVEEILANLFRIEIPLPQNPLKTINSYIIKDGQQSLIIDTGMNREECLKAMSAGLSQIGVDLKKTNFFITHFHADHAGLVSSLATDESAIYFSEKDGAVMNRSANSGQRDQLARRNGYPEDELQKSIKNHPGFLYSSKGPLNLQILKEDDTIGISDYLFKCIETPGHTKGHLCLYEPNKKIFISGDHVLLDITSNISLNSDDENPLEQYLTSLDKVYPLDVELVLPGHRRIFKNYQGRIKELKHHHQVRADEVLFILQDGDKNAFQIASRMTWNMTYESWELFPPAQKWFAFGEALAHLKYLEERGKVHQHKQKHGTVFSLKN